MNQHCPGPLHLAYLGDAVWELHVRRSLLEGEPSRLDDVHRRAVGAVQAAAQAAALHRIEPHLTEEEKEIARRGRNAKNSAPRRVDPLEYRYSTAFECLLGYLYYTGQVERLQEVLRLADEALGRGAGAGGNGTGAAAGKGGRREQ